LCRPETRRTSVGYEQRSHTETASSRIGIHEGAAARRQDQWVAGQQPSDHPALAIAEIGLAIAGEQFGDGAAGRKLDLGIGVAERQSESGGEAAADAGFAGAHQAHQHQAAPRKRGRKLRRGRRPQGCDVACHDG
jgi:hypothetical protein